MKSSYSNRIRLSAALALCAVTLGVQAQYSDRNLKVSTTVGKEHSIALGMLKMADCAASRSGGKMKITLYPGAVLGGDPQVMQQLRTGTVDMMSATPSTLASFMPAAGVFDLPFLIRETKQADAMLDGPAGTHFASLLPDVGLVHLAWTEAGFKQITSSKKPITRHEDLAGQKTRVVQNNMSVDTFAAWGAAPVTLSWTEIYSALESKAIDSQEAAINSIDSARFNEVQKYLSLTRHGYQATMTIISKKTFDQLSATEQGTLKECAVLGRDEQRRLNREQEVKALAKFRAAGLAVNEVSAEERERMYEKAKGIYSKYEKVIGERTYKVFVDAAKSTK